MQYAAHRQPVQRLPRQVALMPVIANREGARVRQGQKVIRQGGRPCRMQGRGVFIYFAPITPPKELVVLYLLAPVASAVD